MALAPVLVTVGTGLAGLGAAAYYTVTPILEAGTATKQARDALASLDPAQQTAYDSLGALKDQFGGFAKALEPQVLDLFNRGLRIARGLLDDIAPVAKAVGDALGGMLGQIDKEFRSGTWQQFFGFMADTAGPGHQAARRTRSSPAARAAAAAGGPAAGRGALLNLTDNAAGKLTGAIATFGEAAADKFGQSDRSGTNTGLLGFLRQGRENVTGASWSRAAWRPGR